LLVLCYLFLVFRSAFAEMNVNFPTTGFHIPLLPFPIFVGEIALIAFGLIWLIDNRPQLWLVVYALWVLLEAAWGYIHIGPYALRNAALFYYPAFAVITYTYGVNQKRFKLYSILFFTTFIFMLYPFTARSQILSLVVAIVLTIICLSKIRKVFLLGLIIPILIFCNSDRGAINSFLHPDRIVKHFNSDLARIDKSFVTEKLPVQIYHKNTYGPRNYVTNPEEPIRAEGNLLNNASFRLLLWRDMAREMLQEGAFLGFGLGHVQRSPSVESLRIAYGEWHRDGWVTAHNSWFHIIYRAGVIGLALIIAFFWLFFDAVKTFIHRGNVFELLLCGMLVYWIVFSCFIVFLELPYNAIPFWCLFGLILRGRLK
jgi:hypothetical protein